MVHKISIQHNQDHTKTIFIIFIYLFIYLLLLLLNGVSNFFDTSIIKWYL